MPKELSGTVWVSRFPDGGDVEKLATPFKAGCKAFITALEAAGAIVAVASTRRPAERAYLMHYAWRIHKRTLNPQNVPPMNGVEIDWVHRRGDGSIELTASRAAAIAMVDKYGIAFQPSLTSNHVRGLAIDMRITWKGKLRVARKDGTLVEIADAPRTGGNGSLHKVGKSYGVIKLVSDPPHWSYDGH